VQLLGRGRDDGAEAVRHHLRKQKKKLDASSGLLATRRRLGRRRDSSALRSALVVCVVCYEGFTQEQKKSRLK